MKNNTAFNLLKNFVATYCKSNLEEFSKKHLEKKDISAIKRCKIENSELLWWALSELMSDKNPELIIEQGFNEDDYYYFIIPIKNKLIKALNLADTIAKIDLEIKLVKPTKVYSIKYI